MSRSILVLGTNAGQADLIRHLRARHWRVIGCSPVPDEVGQRFCDVVEAVDIADLEALEAVARRHAVDLILSVASDVAMRSVVALSERLGLPHFHDSAFVALLDDKAALRAFLAEHELGAVPFRRVCRLEEAEGWRQYPCVVKPVDAQGQRGVERVDEPGALAAALVRAMAVSRSGCAIIEAFLDGVELSCNLLIAGGEVRLQVLSERLVHQAPAMGVPRGHLVPPVAVSKADQEAAHDLVGRILRVMGHPDGALYVQMIMTRDGPRIVEIAPRLDGCHMWRLIALAQGVDLLDMMVTCLTGEAPVSGVPNEIGEETEAGWQTRPVMELMFQQAPPGTIFDSGNFPPPDDAMYHEFRYGDGERIRAVNGSLDVVGYYVRPWS
jgi:biotin carboxylase